MEGPFDVTTCLATGAVLLAGHLYLCGGGFVSMKDRILQQCQSSDAPAQVGRVKDSRVDEAFLQLRQRITRISQECTLHGICLALLWFLYEFATRPGRAQAMRLAATLCPYSLNVLLAREKIELTRRNLQVSQALYMLTFGIFVLAGSVPGSSYNDNATDPVALQAFQLSCRFSMTVFFLDTALVVPCQCLVSLAECWAYSPTRGDSATSFIFAQLVVVIINGSLSLALELCVRSHLRASLASADAESMVQGFRHVLRGICDGEVLLDSKMQICGEGKCLQHLLMTGASLQGRSFVDLIWEEQKREFHKFLEVKGSEEAAPACLRASLRGSCSIRVAVDLFHVPLELYGEKHHLFAFREDGELREVQRQAVEGMDVEASMLGRMPGAEAPSHPSQPSHSQRQNDPGSGCSDSSVGAGCVFSAYPALSEMTLLVDTATPKCDVRQAHLKYRADRERDREEGQASLSSPSLRKLVLPLDWETIRSRATRYVRKAQQGRAEPKNVHGIRLRTESSRKLVIAKTATLLPAQKDPASLVWVHLLDFVEDSSRCRQPPDLAGIREFRSATGVCKAASEPWKIFQEDPRFRTLKILESRSLHRPQANCSHTMVLTKGRCKVRMLVQLVQRDLGEESLRRGMKPRQTMVFCNTLSSCKSVGYQLKEKYSHVQEKIGMLHKEMQTVDRREVLRKFVEGEYNVLVTTDLAQRGLDLPNCEHVVNFDFPLNSIDYLHRAGRTARFGEPGKVTSLVKKGDKYLAKAIERCVQLGKPINELRKPQYNTAIGAYGRQSRWLQSLCLLSALLQQGLRATMVSRSAALGACSKASRWQAGLCLLRSIAASGQQANAVPCNAAISGVGSVRGAWYRSRHLLDDMRWHTVFPTVVTLGALIASCSLHALWSAALRSVAMMQELHVQPDLVAQNSLSDAAAAAANWPLASKLMEEMREARLRRDAVGMTTLLQAFAEGARWHRALNAWAGFAQDGMSRNVIQLNSVTNSLGRGQNWEQATQTTRSIREALRPDAITLAASSAACGEALQWEAAMQLFAFHFCSGAALTASCATTAMAAARRAGHWRRVLGISAALGRWQVAEDLVCFTEQLAAFADSCRWRSAVAALRAQASRSLRPDTTALNTCLAAFGSTWRKLVLHLQEACAQGSVDAVSFHCAASSCAAAGEVGAALRLVEQGRSQSLDTDPVVLAAAALTSAPPQLLAALRAPCLDRLRRTDAKQCSDCASTKPLPECTMCALQVFRQARLPARRTIVYGAPSIVSASFADKTEQPACPDS
ncbi:RH39 [Symbiodinium sp. CCMP2456]|nr:RH39 [Symbiodinium sp. CCMP2456]